jgi:CRISPR-associated endonuclease Csn1
MNTLNSEHTRNEMLVEINTSNVVYKEKLSLLDKYLISKKPFSTHQVEEVASKVLISFKAGKKVATIGKRKVKKNGKKQVVQEGIIEPRGPLSEESVYGKIKVMKEKMPVKVVFDNPNAIVKERIKNLVIERINEHKGDSKAAISSLKKRPIFLDEAKTQILEYATIFEEEYVIKYPLATIDLKRAEKIVDKLTKEVVLNRLKEFGGNTKTAYAQPLYLDEANTIPIKSVRCFTGLSAVEPIKVKDEVNGIEYEKYVKPGNNHHVAIYKDNEGNLEEHIATFWHAVERKKYHIPVVINDSTKVWDNINNSKVNYSENFLLKLPKDGLMLHLSMQQNEMFVLGMNDEAFQEAVKNKNYAELSKYLYRVQKLAAANYVFRHHLETEIIDDNNAKISKRFFIVQSLGALEKLNPKKVKINILGEVE